MQYDYLEAMVEDIDLIKSDYDWDVSDKEELAYKMHDDLWNCDSVTGNLSGSYTNSKNAREYVLSNMDLCIEALNDFCVEEGVVGRMLLNKNWEWFDVLIRCNLLAVAIEKYLEIT